MSASPADFRPADVEIRGAERVLLVGGKPVALGARAFDLLTALYECRDRVVSKHELLERVWPGLVVEENNLQVQVGALRKVLGPAAIATVPGRGYRFTLPAQALAASAPAAAVPSAASAADEVAAGNLPAAPPLLGRDEELAALARLIDDEAVVSIVGAGGIGKTRLALVAARASTRDTPDGRWWVELAPLGDPQQLPSVIAAVMGVQLDGGGGRRPAEALATRLARKRCLLVLDNCEHLADAVAELVSELRAQAPGVRILVTSQELLKCPDEWAFRLGSLRLPASADLEHAAHCGAVALFVARARAADPRFALTAGNVAAVVDVCRRLDGIALAIELAAARVPMLGIQGLQSRLDAMFHVLTGASRMRLRRHQTLRAAMEWSCQLLDDDERAVFRRLGVFAGGFTLELAQALASDERMDRWQVLDRLSQLIDKSLVVAEGEGEPRYRLLEPTRAYALEQLAAAGESQALLRRHAQVMTQAMADWNAGRWTMPTAQRLLGLVELGNVRAAADWAVRADRQQAIRLMGEAWFLWIGNNQGAELLERLLALWPLPAGLSEAEEAAFCLALASVRHAGARDEVLQAARRAVQLYRAMGDEAMLAEALLRLVAIGCAYTDVGDDLPDTDPALEEATRRIGDGSPPRLRGSLAMLQGLRALSQRRFAEAADAYRRQARCAREDGSEFSEWLATFNVAWALLDLGEVASAIETLERVVAGLQRLRAPYGLGPARSLLTLARALRGDDEDGLPSAREAFRSALASGPAACEKPLMAAAAFHARRGELWRAALIAGCVQGPNVRGRKRPCPMDERLDAEVRQRLAEGLGSDERARLQRLGAGLLPADVAPAAFDGAPLDSLPPAAAPGRPAA